MRACGHKLAEAGRHGAAVCAANQWTCMCRENSVLHLQAKLRDELRQMHAMAFMVT